MKLFFVLCFYFLKFYSQKVEEKERDREGHSEREIDNIHYFRHSAFEFVMLLATKLLFSLCFRRFPLFFLISLHGINITKTTTTN